MKKLLISILVLSIAQSTHSMFSTLSHIKKYAAAHDEFPQPDNDNWLSARFTQFHKQHKPHPLTQWLIHTAYQLHLYSPRTYLIQKQINHLLETITYQLQKQRSKGTGPWIETYKPAPESQFIIFGELNGAFHSLVRDLEQLARMDIITEHLKVTTTNYIVFLGNAVNNAPYLMETLAVIAMLMKINPDKVFYLAGFAEVEENWADYGLKDEIDARTSYYADKGSYYKTISNFFNELPWALYLQTNIPDMVVRLSYFSTSPDMLLNEVKLAQQLNETNYASFLKTPALNPQQFTLTNIIPEETQPITVAARIEGTTKEVVYQPTNGLMNKTPQLGATTWEAFAGSTERSQKLFHFFNNAFVILKTAELLDEWTVTLYKQHVQTKEGFQPTTYNLISGFPQTDLISIKTQLILGCSLDLSKSNKFLSQRVQEGINLRIRQQNAYGGLKGDMIKIVFIDDEYTPRLTVANVDLLRTSYHTDLLLSPVGTPTNAALLPGIKDKQFISIFPFSGSTLFRQPELSYIINFRNTMATEATALVTYASDNLSAHKFAFFYQDDDYGKGALAGAVDALKKRGITNWIEISYNRNNQNISSEAIQKFISFDPDTVLFFSTPGPSEAFVKKVGLNRFVNKTLLAISFVTDAFRSFLKDRGMSLIMAQNMPNPYTSTLEIVREYQQNMERFYPTRGLTTDSLEGYTVTSIFLNVLETLDKPYTKDKIMAAMEKLTDSSFKGLHLHFDPKTRQLSTAIWIDNDSDEWMQVQS